MRVAASPGGTDHNHRLAARSCGWRWRHARLFLAAAAAQTLLLGAGGGWSVLAFAPSSTAYGLGTRVCASASSCRGSATLYTPLGVRFQPRPTAEPERRPSSSSAVPSPASSCTRLGLTASSSTDGGGILSNDTTQKVASTTLLIILDVFTRHLFLKFTIKFPSSLAGCGFLFAALLALDGINSTWADNIYETLAPGAGVLAKWLPVFFVPSLVTLPLAPSLGGGMEAAKVAAVIVGGFFFTLLTTSWSVLGVRKLQGNASSTDEQGDSDGRGDGSPEPAAAKSPSTPPKAFADSTANGLAALTALSGSAAVLANRAGSALSNPLQSAYMLFATLSTFVFGARLPKKFTKIVHPLVTCTALTWAGAKLMAAFTGRTFLSMLGSYKAGTLAPKAAGAGDVLLFMLGPAVVALACQMYDRRKLMRRNVAEVGAAVGVSSVGGLFGTAAMVRALGIASPTLRLCLLSRNITSPLAMAIATILGADVSLAVSMVVVTGLIGANFGASILDFFGVRDAVARGLGIGAAAHGLGTAAFAGEEDAFPFAAIAMALTASACTVLVSIPTVKNALLKIALGG